ncbi:diguanylate cyclase [Halomonas vilamensis]|uniref:diguanylate cyclase n=1 Tax=Vreelandella vilamensis TaxID=531309 RepID=A0ABU1H338_9GAMM|nr:diguanylate cyclase [Halomonas vilamensis]MDR5898706.1 diguanylate cyclase [Halomonas vilamensis]
MTSLCANNSSANPFSTRALAAQAAQIQPFGAVVAVDSACRQVHSVSANLGALLDIALPAPDTLSLACLLGKRLSQRLRRAMQGREHLPAPLTFVRQTHGRNKRYQVHALRSGSQVLVEIEPLQPLGKWRLLGAVNERLMQLADATHQEELLDNLVKSIQELTGYDRVVVCHFDSDWHGFILAEALGGRLPTLLGQRFPASEFPVGLRHAYERNPIRYIQDIEAPAVGFLPKPTAPSLEDSLLRAPAADRVRYLQKLNVRGSLSLAMQGDAGLWGMVVCHAATPYPTPPPVRDAVRALVQMATQRLLLLQARQEARYLQRVQDSLVLSSTTRKEPQSPAQLLKAQAETWMALFRAHGVALWIDGNTYLAGSAPAPTMISQLVKRLARTHDHAGPWCSRELAKNPLTSSLAMGEHCGLLAVPLPLNLEARGWLLFFRPQQVEALYWAMQLSPRDPKTHHPKTHHPHPSPSQPSVLTLPSPCAAWCEEVIGKSEAWQRVERLAAMDLGEDLTLAISAYEISKLNGYLEQERKALADANQRLEQLAHFDPLTQVWNRYRIEQAIDAELVAAKRYGAQFGLLLFDVDHFKEINDTHGHALGDDVLIALASLVENSLRGCDHLGRWGGEEFVVLAKHADIEALIGLAERLRELITTLNVEGLHKPLTVSIGVAEWQPDDSCKSMVARADKAMYRAKHEGRNRVEVATREVS